MEEQEQMQDGAPFNFALRFYMDLADLINEKDRAYLNDEIHTYCKALDRIYNRISFKIDLNEEDEKYFKEKFIEVIDYSS